MDTPKPSGAALHGDDADARRQAASLMGKARTEKKIAAARAVAASRKGSKWTEEQKAALRVAQQARREREKAEKGLLGMAAPVTEKRPPGRPRTQPEASADTPKRPRGRPRKEAGNG